MKVGELLRTTVCLYIYIRTCVFFDASESEKGVLRSFAILGTHVKAVFVCFIA